MVSDLDTIKNILMDSDTFIKLNQSKQFKRIISLDKNIAVVDGDEWKRHKKVVNPAFKRGWDIKIFIKVGIKAINYMKKNGNDFELIKLLKNSTLDSLGLSIFDVDFNSIEDENCEISTLYVNFIKGINNIWFLLFPFLDNLPIPSRIQLKKDTDRFCQLLKDLINGKREQIKKYGVDNVKSSLLTMLIQSSDDNNSISDGLTDEEIISDVIVFFIAGHDTTAHTLSSILYYLSKDQDIQNKLRDEIIHVLGERSKNINEDIQITQEDLNKMKYLEAVINEGMRILPVASIITRQVAKDYYFNNEIQFKKGQPLLLNLALAMNNETKFKHPEEFNPNRFLIQNEKEEIQIDKKLTKDMIGFSVGPRMCIGNQFSLLEQKVFLILILLKFNVELPQDSIHCKHPILPALGISSPKDLKLNFIPI
ncbi:cytochrome P450 [Neoconidiobolus thromboides FSU 785]|nr:cytochrome P450 [Neoconidiobolus thromboides FSU 785]